MFKRFRCKIPMNIQLFADGDGGAAGGTGEGGTSPAGSQAPQFDYDKLASLIAGKQTVTEESVLKGYFKQQGLSKSRWTRPLLTLNSSRLPTSRM